VHAAGYYLEMQDVGGLYLLHQPFQKAILSPGSRKYTDVTHDFKYDSLKVKTQS
jgi:hypothetical protein